MCNIAGYVGKKQAAPILIEMMRREEGFAGGFYTGMTVHDGEHLVSEKVLGGLDHLLNETPCREMCGTCGFIHSRSKSGGGREWAQPFLSADRRSSLIANGAAGCFLTDDFKKKRCDIALMLEEKGYSYGSRVSGAIGNYPALSDGTAIHSTDLMCQYVTYLVDQGMPIDAAMSQLLTDLPTEAVFLLMREEAPESIFITRINYPMTVGIAEDGDIYLATTRLAFPQDVVFRQISLLPPMQTYEATRGACRTSSFALGLTEKVAEITPERSDRAYELFLEAISSKTKPVTAGALIPSYNDVWPPEEIPQKEPMFYEMIERLALAGRLGITPITEPGAADGYTADRFGVYLK